MSNFNDPVHVVDFQSARNCTELETIEPGQEINILVRLESPAGSPAIQARARRSQDGKTVEVSVQTAQGEEAHTWSWSILQDALRVHRGKSTS